MANRLDFKFKFWLIRTGNFFPALFKINLDSASGTDYSWYFHVKLNEQSWIILSPN